MNLAADPALLVREPVLTVIPARLGATRLPRKPLRDLCGKPLIVRVYERVLSLGLSKEVIVATDHEDVVQACSNHNVPACLTDTAHPSGSDRVAEVARRPEYSHYDVILNVQGDEPFVSEDAVAGALEQVLAGGADAGTAAVRLAPESFTAPDVVKVVTDIHGRALYFSRAGIPWLRDEGDRSAWEPLLRQHIGVYAYRREALLRWVSLPPHPLETVEKLEQLRALANGISIGVHTSGQTAERGIDTEEDLKYAVKLFQLRRQ